MFPFSCLSSHRNRMPRQQNAMWYSSLTWAVLVTYTVWGKTVNIGSRSMFFFNFNYTLVDNKMPYLLKSISKSVDLNQAKAFFFPWKFFSSSVNLWWEEGGLLNFHKGFLWPTGTSVALHCCKAGRTCWHHPLLHRFWILCSKDVSPNSEVSQHSLTGKPVPLGLPVHRSDVRGLTLPDKLWPNQPLPSAERNPNTHRDL